MTADEVAAGPLVRLNSGQGNATSINIDNFGGAVAMVKHLASSGPPAYRVHLRTAAQRRRRRAPARVSLRHSRAPCVADRVPRRLYRGGWLSRRERAGGTPPGARRDLRGERFHGHRRASCVARRQRARARRHRAGRLRRHSYRPLRHSRAHDGQCGDLGTGTARLRDAARRDQRPYLIPTTRKFPTRLVVRESCGSQLRSTSHPQLSLHRGGGKA